MLDGGDPETAHEWIAALSRFSTPEGVLIVTDDSLPDWERLQTKQALLEQSRDAAKRRGIEPLQPRACPPLRFVQARAVHSAQPMRKDLAQREFYRVRSGAGLVKSTASTSQIARAVVAMVTVEPWDDTPLPGGRSIERDDLFCEPDAARAQLIGAYEAAEEAEDEAMGNAPARGRRAFTRASPNPSGAAATGATSFAMDRAREDVNQPYDVNSVERFTGITRKELEGGALWWSRPRRWRLMTAWFIHLMLFCGCAVTLLLLPWGRLEGVQFWVNGVVLALAEAQALKLVILEPAVAVIGAVLPRLIFRMLPEDVADEIADMTLSTYLPDAVVSGWKALTSWC